MGQMLSLVKGGLQMASLGFNLGIFQFFACQQVPPLGPMIEKIVLK